MKKSVKASLKTPWILSSHNAAVSFYHKPPKRVEWGFHSTAALGRLLVGVDEKGALCILTFAGGTNAKRAKSTIDQWQKKWPKTEFVENERAIAAMADGIFARNKKLKVAMFGTPFQQAVWKVIASIPAGKTITYADLAKKVKNPKAVRAAGTACGANPVAVVVPCHRVVGTNGGLGGFGGGLPLKRVMLAAESVSK